MQQRKIWTSRLAGPVGFGMYLSPMLTSCLVLLEQLPVERSLHVYTTMQHNGLNVKPKAHATSRLALARFQMTACKAWCDCQTYRIIKAA